jgi:hypothetical protein
MSEQELDAITKHLEEHLNKGLIRESSPPAEAPVLLVLV